jgi:hypothetical protein
LFNVLQFIAVAAAAYCAYRWLGGWPMAAAVVVAYFLLSYLYRSSRERSERVQAALIVGTPLSPEEKLHLGNMQERNQRLAARQAAKNKNR